MTPRTLENLIVAKVLLPFLEKAIGQGRIDQKLFFNWRSIWQMRHLWLDVYVGCGYTIEEKNKHKDIFQ